MNGDARSLRAISQAARETEMKLLGRIAELEREVRSLRSENELLSRMKSEPLAEGSYRNARTPASNGVHLTKLFRDDPATPRRPMKRGPGASAGPLGARAVTGSTTPRPDSRNP